MLNEQEKKIIGIEKWIRRRDRNSEKRQKFGKKRKNQKRDRYSEMRQKFGKFKEENQNLEIRKIFDSKKKHGSRKRERNSDTSEKSWTIPIWPSGEQFIWTLLFNDQWKSLIKSMRWILWIMRNLKMKGHVDNCWYLNSSNPGVSVRLELL